MEGLIAADNERDIGRVLGYYAPDAVLMPPGEPPVTERAGIQARYDALAAKQIEVANGFATDWQIADGKLVALDDDKQLFPPYYVAPVIRQDTLAANPKIAATLDALSPLLDNDTMRKLNARVEKDREEPKDVAKAFLKEKGVIK